MRITERAESYIAAFQEAASRDSAVIHAAAIDSVAIDGAAPCVEVPPGTRCAVLSGVLRVARLLNPPAAAADAETVLVFPGMHITSMYDLISCSRTPTVVLSLVPDPPTFAGQSRAYRAVVSPAPSSGDVLASRSEVVVLRVDRDSLLERVPPGSLSMQDAALALTEITARVQELCLVALTPLPRKHESLGLPFDLLEREAALRRRFVPGVPDRHDTLFVTREVASQALQVLVESGPELSVEDSLSDLYARSGCIVRWDEPYPLNRVPARLQEAPRHPAPLAVLPKVSVLTITRNRPRIFILAANVFMNLDYPAELLEWVVVDDSDEGRDARGSLGALRNDRRVKYARIAVEGDKPLNVGLKRNVACKMASGDVFVHLDDDDYIPPSSVHRRVSALQSTGARCAGSSSTLCFDVFSHKTYFSQVTDVLGDRVFFPEPGMMYTRGFWEERNWDRDAMYDEGRAFLRGRDPSDLVDVAPTDNVIMISHSENMTRGLRRMTAEAPLNRPEALFSESYCRLLKAVHNAA